MSDDKQQPRKRIKIPTPKELDESVVSGQSQQDASQEQKGVRSRVRRFRMRMRGGVGQNKKVLNAPRPDAKPIGEAPPGEQGSEDVESSLSEPSSEWVIGDEGNQIQEEVVPQRQIPGRIQPLKDEPGKEDKREYPSGSHIRAVKPPKPKKRKKEPGLVPDDDTRGPLSNEELAQKLARCDAHENGHDMGDFVEHVRLDRNKQFTATCKKCNSDIVAFVTFEDYDMKGLPEVGGNAKGKTCPGEVGNYSSGTS